MEELKTQVTLENLLQESCDIVPVRYQKCVSEIIRILILRTMK